MPRSKHRSSGLDGSVVACTGSVKGSPVLQLQVPQIVEEIVEVAPDRIMEHTVFEVPVPQISKGIGATDVEKNFEIASACSAGAKSRTNRGTVGFSCGSDHGGYRGRYAVHTTGAHEHFQKRVAKQMVDVLDSSRHRTTPKNELRRSVDILVCQSGRKSRSLRSSHRRSTSIHMSQRVNIHVSSDQGGSLGISAVHTT